MLVHMHDGPMWTDVLQAISAASVPVILGIVGIVVTKRQNRSSELVKARLDYYRLIAPKLNLLMSYITYIGRWRDQSPSDIIELKRKLDEEFFVAAPLFSSEVSKAYGDLMTLSFKTFGEWGQDARILSSGYQRRESWRGHWDTEWNSFFTIPDNAETSRDSLTTYRKKYDALLAAMVKDIDITRTRAKYTTDEAVLNAQAPQRTEIEGST